MASMTDIIPYLESIMVEGEEEEGEIKYHYIERLDAPRNLPDPIDLTINEITAIINELGLIKLCWPYTENVEFEDRVNFPESYLANTTKEKLLQLYTENFRKQFTYKFPRRKPLFLVAKNECGMQKMVCNTLRPTMPPYPEIETWEECSKFVGRAMKFEPYEVPTLIPNRFYSPHTTLHRQSGQPHELACLLCSLLIGLGYDAYMVFGYATRDVTLRIMIRVDSPYPPEEELGTVADEGLVEKKYAVKPPRDLRSKFLIMMEQREVDRINAEKEKQLQIEREQQAEEEKPPPDDLDGMRIHFWVMIRPEGRPVDKVTFVEPSTGSAHSIETPFYSGIEAVWNHMNYWINMQDCRDGLSAIDYDLQDVTKWEHLLIGEPLSWRETEVNMNMDDEEMALAKIMEEKHLDMPIPWSLKTDVPHKMMKQKFPGGVNKTWYKRTLVEEYAPYVQRDGLVTKITRFKDFDCTQYTRIEELYENRQDKLKKVIRDMDTDLVTEYFERGREDAVLQHIYFSKVSTGTTRTIKFNSPARYDSLSQIVFDQETMEEEYVDREDLFYYRLTHFAKKGFPPPGVAEGPRKIILDITEKSLRNIKIPASEDIAVREFKLIERQIHLKYHFGEGRVTASTRNFIKPAIAETGEGMMFTPELTSGYESEIGAKPASLLKIYLTYKRMLQEEENSIVHIREVEDQIAEFLHLRNQETAFPKLDVSLFNIEQNETFRQAMLEKEKEEQEHKERETDADAGVEYLAPYLNKLGRPERLSHDTAAKIKEQCLTDFRHLLLERAIDIQKQFESWRLFLRERQNWFNINQDVVSEEEETKYFQDVNDLTFLLQCYEIRLTRHKDLSRVRYDAMERYLNTELKKYTER